MNRTSNVILESHDQPHIVNTENVVDFFVGNLYMFCEKFSIQQTNLTNKYCNRYKITCFNCSDCLYSLRSYY